MHTYRQVSRETKSNGNNPNIHFIAFPAPSFGDFKAAGFPQHFLVIFREPGSPDTIVFSFLRLISNIGIWSVFLTLALAFDYRTQRAKKLRAENAKTRGFSILDLLVITTVIAALFALYRWHESKREKDKAFANEIVSAGGVVDFSLWLPTWMESLIPTMFLERGLTISGVALSAPDDEMIQRILAIESLSDLRFGGGTYDLGLLSGLCKNPYLQSLRLSGRTLDRKTIATIAQCKQLVSLDLTRTNITAKALMLFGEMKRLKHLNITHTDVRLSEIPSLAFAPSLRAIALPHPSDGNSDSLKLSGWPELTLLVCTEFDELLNEMPMSIELSEMPKLEKLGLDSFQAYDLKLKNLPRLKSIDQMREQSNLRVGAQDTIPANLQVRHFSLENVPNLHELSLDGASLATFELLEPRLERLRLLASRIGRFGGAEDSPFESLRGAKVNLLLKSDVVDGLADSQGPSMLELGGQLSKTTFTKLAKNRSIQSLDLSKVPLDASTFEQLGAFQQLKEIKFGENALKGREIAWLAASIKSLTKINAIPVNIGKLRLEGNDTIETIFYPKNQSAQNIESLRLIDVPKLGEIFELPSFLTAIHIEHAPSIKGLGFRSPMPKFAIITGLRDLRHFAGGGELLTDAHVESVLECAQLEKLTLAYSNISSSVFAKIGTLTNLKYLVLTGSSVDDESVMSWNNLKSLRTLRLDNTQITDRSMSWILEQKELETLQLDDVKLTTESCQRLGDLKKLKHLSLSGVAVNEDVLRSIITLPLESLNLSGSQLGPEEMQILIKSPIQTLEKLSLQRCKLDGESLLSLAKVVPNMRLDLSTAEVDPKVWQSLLQQNRIFIAEDEKERSDSPFGRRTAAMQIQLQLQVQGMSAANGVYGEPKQKYYDGEVPPYFYAPEGSTSNKAPTTRSMR